MTSNDNLCQDKISNDDWSPYCEIPYLNKGEEDEMEIYGYKKNVTRTTVTWICIVLSLGILRIIFHWYQHWMLYCTHRQCPLKYADNVLVLDKYQGCHTTYYVKPVKRISFEKLSPEDVAVVCNDLVTKNVAHAANEAGSVVRIYFNDGSFMDESDFIEIRVKKLSYMWCNKINQFCKVAGIEKGLTKTDLHNLSGYSKYQQLLRRIIHGKNEIEVKVDSIGTLFLLEVLNPFYMFQLFSLILWFVEVYLYYSFAIIAMSLFGIILTVLQTRQNQKQLAQTVQTEGNVTVCRNIGKSKHDAIYEEIAIHDLVPGDVIVVPRTGFVIPCDAVLLSGHCIVNESMLTGESVPVTKTALPCLNSPYNEVEDGNHTLYCGTQILQARYYANEVIHAVVLRTGFLTAKGNLVRSILYPLPHDFKFDQDIYKFVWILAGVAVIGTSYAFYTKINNGDPLFQTIIDSLDIITIVIPPALPAALSVGKYYAQNRLQKQKISCMNASVINVSGSVNCICFDKTGTLTEDGLDLYGVIPVNNQVMDKMIANVENYKLTNLKEAMASCHSLTLINGVISGDPLDVKMFEATGWVLDETEVTDTIKFDLLAPTVVRSPIQEDQEIGIIHQFQFSSRLQRMSVITRHLNSKKFTIYCKGSPEMIVSLCLPDSVPKDLETELEKQTEKGYRVIAIGYRTFPAIDIIKLKRLHRNDVECNLTFAGLIVFENKLKPQTISIISDLRQANMKLVMLTGDNIQTAISVAKECGIIAGNEVIINVSVITNKENSNPQLTYTPSKSDLTKYMPENSKIFSISDLEWGIVYSNQKYALTGHTWKTIKDSFPQKIQHILHHGVIFARMSSDQKQQIIQELQAMKFYVAMCGDGANDCGALKTADVGISLSEAESSVASPFTSHQPDISCVPKIIKEGRTALVTAVGLFKFMVLYSLLEFFSSVYLFTYHSSLSDFEFLFIDIFLIVIFAFFFGQTKPFRGPLVPKPPSSSLLSALPLLSILFQLCLMVGMQILSESIIKHFDWYRPPFHNLKYSTHETYDNYAIYTTSQFQYIILAVTFSVGRPYREAIYKNVYFFLSLIVITFISVFITLYPPPFLVRLFDFKLPPSTNFRYIIVSLSVITFVISIFLESFVTNYVLSKILSYKKTKKNRTKYSKEKIPSDLIKSSFQHLSEIEVKCYGTMKS